MPRLFYGLTHEGWSLWSTRRSPRDSEIGLFTYSESASGNGVEVESRFL